MERIYIAAGEEFCTKEKHIPAPLFKKIFNWDKKDCRLVISAAGIYRLFLNGEELTKGFFAPYISNPDHIAYYDEYDIGAKLKEKDNVLCVMLGNGFNNVVFGGWEFDKAAHRSAPKFYLSLLDGEKTVFTTGGKDDFAVMDSPVIFDDIRGGERYDARKEIDGVLTNTSLEGFRVPIVAPLQPKGEYRLRTADPVLSFEELSPVEIIKSGDYHIFDFGENNAGVCRLKINGKAGQRIDIWHVEALTDNEPQFYTVAFKGNDLDYVQHDVYICKDGEQEYAPNFTYHGFRYACVKGMTDEQATKDALAYIVRHSDIHSRGKFVCSNEILNAVQEWIKRSDVSNFHCFPTDCPHREKNGWTGDANLSAEQMMYNFNPTASFREWLHNIRKTQIEDGRITCIIPTTGWKYEGANGPAWEEVMVELPYQVYRFNGDTEIIKENADAIFSYLKFLTTKKNENGLICFGMVDWCEAGKVAHYAAKTRLEVIDSLISVDYARKAAEILRVIGQNERAEYCDAFGDELIANFRKKYITADGKHMNPTQAGISLSIMLGAYKTEELPVAYEELKQAVLDADCHMTVGVIGIKYLFDALTKGGMLDLAIEILTKEDHPSFGYLKKLGATTLWEAFILCEEGGVRDLKRILDDPETPSWAAGLPSLNHHFFGSVSAWFYKTLAGVEILGHGKARISPKIPTALTFAEGEIHCDENFVKVRWEKDGDLLRLTTNSQGFVGVISIDGYSANGETELSLQSGEHTYLFQKI